MTKRKFMDLSSVALGAQNDFLAESLFRKIYLKVYSEKELGM